MLRSPFLLAVIMLVVIVGLYLLGAPRENGCCSFRDFSSFFFFRKHNGLIQMQENIKCVFRNKMKPLAGNLLFTFRIKRMENNKNTFF